MKLWILIFSAALFAGGTCLGVALHPRIALPKPAEAPSAPALNDQYRVARLRPPDRLAALQ